MTDFQEEYEKNSKIIRYPPLTDGKIPNRVGVDHLLSDRSTVLTPRRNLERLFGVITSIEPAHRALFTITQPT